MNKNGNHHNLAIKPIQILSKPLISQNFMNSPKSNHIRMFKQQHSLYSARSMGDSYEESTVRTKNEEKYSFNINNDQGQIKDHGGLAGDGRMPENCHLNSGGVSGRLMVQNTQNLLPNNAQYEQMHLKLNTLQNKLTSMRQKFNRKKQEKAKHATQEDKKSTSMNSKSKSRDKQRKQQKQKNRKNEKNTETLKQLVSQVACKTNMKVLSSDPYSPKNNIYYVSEIVRMYKQENSLARDHLINSHRQLKALQKIRGLNQQVLDQIQLKLKTKQHHQGKKTIVFDLDQTLIHCNENANAPCDVKLKIKFSTGQFIQAGINIRPHAVEILKNLSKKFEIIVFTASHASYANEVLNYLDPHNEYISHRLFREHCYQTPEGIFIKDLRVINRQLSQIVLIDNAAYSYCLQIENGVPIIPYYEGKVDFELKALERYLDGLTSCKDVRDINRNVFKLNKYAQFDHPDLLVQNLYSDVHL